MYDKYTRVVASESWPGPSEITLRELLRPVLPRPGCGGPDTWSVTQLYLQHALRL